MPTVCLLGADGVSTPVPVPLSSSVPEEEARWEEREVVETRRKWSYSCVLRDDTDGSRSDERARSGR